MFDWLNRFLPSMPGDFRFHQWETIDEFKSELADIVSESSTDTLMEIASEYRNEQEKWAMGEMAIAELAKRGELNNAH